MKVIININDSLIKHKLIKNVFLIQSVFHSKTEKSLLHLGEYTDLCAVEDFEGSYPYQSDVFIQQSSS